MNFVIGHQINYTINREKVRQESNLAKENCRDLPLFGATLLASAERKMTPQSSLRYFSAPLGTCDAIKVVKSKLGRDRAILIKLQRQLDNPTSF